MELLAPQTNFNGSTQTPVYMASMRMTNLLLVNTVLVFK